MIKGNHIFISKNPIFKMPLFNEEEEEYIITTLYEKSEGILKRATRIYEEKMGNRIAPGTISSRWKKSGLEILGKKGRGKCR